MNSTLTEHRRRLKAGAVYHGTWMMTSSADIARISSAAGFDYVCVDMQHGLARAEHVSSLLDAIRSGGDPLAVVRVAANRFAEIGMVADAGADAIIVPLVSSADEARAAVSAVSFVPQGGYRSWGPTDAIFRGLELDPAALRPLLFVMIENRAGFEALDEILAVPGIDGVYVGPSDLAFGLGSAPGPEEQVTTEAIARILAVTREAGLIPAVHTGAGSEARRRREQGFRFLTTTSDVNALRAGYAADLTASKEQSA
ncbi:MAG: HpcH/HpaI aldolase family protein [Brachybacterium sp.]